MTPNQYHAAIKDIDTHLEGSGFSLNVYARSGHIYSDYRAGRIGVVSPVLRLDKDDHPPVYVAVEDVIAIELVS